MKKILIIIIALFVIGCATPMPDSSPMPTGGKATAPSGWVDYQHRGGE